MATKALVSDDPTVNQGDPRSMPPSDLPTSTDDTRGADLRAAEDGVYGENPLRDRDGKPLEMGAGSAYARSSHADKAHLEVVRVNSIVGDVQAAAKVLLDHTARLTEAAKSAVGFTASAKSERADAIRAAPARSDEA